MSHSSSWVFHNLLIPYRGTLVIPCENTDLRLDLCKLALVSGVRARALRIESTDKFYLPVRRAVQSSLFERHRNIQERILSKIENNLWEMWWVKGFILIAGHQRKTATRNRIATYVLKVNCHQQKYPRVTIICLCRWWVSDYTKFFLL